MFAPLVHQGFHDTTGEIRWTHSMMALRQKLDHIYVRAAHPMQSRAWTAGIPGSDHLPVFAEFQIVST
jgi:endonuclease/exonuclease/phosphatase (EEP) superfamily protein YafD